MTNFESFGGKKSLTPARLRKLADREAALEKSPLFLKIPIHYQINLNVPPTPRVTGIMAYFTIRYLTNIKIFRIKRLLNMLRDRGWWREAGYLHRWSIIIKRRNLRRRREWEATNSLRMPKIKKNDPWLYYINGRWQPYTGNLLPSVPCTYYGGKWYVPRLPVIIRAKPLPAVRKKKVTVLPPPTLWRKPNLALSILRPNALVLFQKRAFSTQPRPAKIGIEQSRSFFLSNNGSLSIHGSTIAVKLAQSGTGLEKNYYFVPNQSLLRADPNSGISPHRYFFYGPSYLNTFFSQLRALSMAALKPYHVKFNIKGVGYRIWSWRKKYLFFKVGYTHKFVFRLPEDLGCKVHKYRFILFSFNKAKLFETAKFLLSLRFPDAYKGKGVRYDNDRVFMKTKLKDTKRR